MASRLTAELLLEIGKFRSSLKQAGKAAQGFGVTSGGSSGSGFVGGFVKKIVKAGTFITAALVLTMTAAATAAAAVAGKIIAASIKAAARHETFQMRFEILTGSRGAGNDALNEMREDALRTGIAVSDMADNVGKFIAFGFDPAQALKLNKGILDVGGSVGLTSRDMKLLGVALSQVAAKGVASMEELRQQIAEKGIPIFKALEKQLGVTGAELSKMIQNGEVSADEVMKIFTAVPDGEGPFAKFAGGADRMAGTFMGLVGRIKTAWTEFLLVMGEPIRDAISPILKKGLAMVDKLREQAAKIGTFIADIITYSIAMFKVLKTMNWGEIGELLLHSLMFAVTTAGNWMWKTFVSAAQGVGKFLLLAVVNMIKMLGILGKADFWKGMGQMLLGLAMQFGAAVVSVMRMAIETANWATGGLAFKDSLKHMKELEESSHEAANNMGMDGYDLVGEAIEAHKKKLGIGEDEDGMKFGDPDRWIKEGGPLKNFLGEVQTIFEQLKSDREKLTASKNVTGGPEQDNIPEDLGPGGEGAGVRQVGLNGAIAQAVNALAGRSASELISQEAKKANALAAKGNVILKKIEENTAKKPERAMPLPAHVDNQQIARFA